jgi:hypothetical protein
MLDSVLSPGSLSSWEVIPGTTWRSDPGLDPDPGPNPDPSHMQVREYEKKLCDFNDASMRPEIYSKSLSRISGEKLYIVVIVSTFNLNLFRCGGALVRPSWIITAGHCVKSEKRPSKYRFNQHSIITLPTSFGEPLRYGPFFWIRTYSPDPDILAGSRN